MLNSIAFQDFMNVWEGNDNSTDTIVCAYFRLGSKPNVLLNKSFGFPKLGYLQESFNDITVTS